MSDTSSTIVKLRDGELAELTKLSDRNRVVHCSFGPGWVGIDSRPENEWALRELVKIRERWIN